MREEDKMLITLGVCLLILSIMVFMLKLWARLDVIDKKLNTIIESVEAAPLNKFEPVVGIERTPEEPSDDEIVMSLIDQYQKEVEIVADMQASEETTTEASKSEKTASESPCVEGFKEIIEPEPYVWDGPRLTAAMGVNNGPSGKETYYNLPMGGCIQIMRDLGYSAEEYPFWIRDDGAKMLGEYVMCAADFNTRPRGTILETSLGKAIVVDTGYFAYSNPTQIDLATSW